MQKCIMTESRAAWTPRQCTAGHRQASTHGATPCLNAETQARVPLPRRASCPACSLFFFTSCAAGRRCVPVHVRSSLLQHWLLSFLNLFWVQHVKEVDRHEEWHRNILPHGVGHFILRVDDCVLTKHDKKRYSSEPSIKTRNVSFFFCFFLDKTKWCLKYVICSKE